MTAGSTTRRIEPQFRGKIWGSTRIAPWFGACGTEKTQSTSAEKIGEVWFPAGDLLVKFLFTSEKLSVQVHPDDDYAQLLGHPSGKTEMWHILRADEGARLALGFNRPISPEEAITAAQSGAIMGLLNWIDVNPGETYFVPAGTVHAIGEGLALCEIQQNSDVTFRLFDYGRDRELHLQSAKDVLQGTYHPGQALPRDVGGGIELLVECPWFQTYRATVDRARLLGAGGSPDITGRLLVVLEGTGRVNDMPASPGNVLETLGTHQWLVEPDTGCMELLLVAQPPAAR